MEPLLPSGSGTDKDTHGKAEQLKKTRSDGPNAIAASDLVAEKVDDASKLDGEAQGPGPQAKPTSTGEVCKGRQEIERDAGTQVGKDASLRTFGADNLRENSGAGQPPNNGGENQTTLTKNEEEVGIGEANRPTETESDPQEGLDRFMDLEVPASGTRREGSKTIRTRGSSRRCRHGTRWGSSHKNGRWS